MESQDRHLSVSQIGTYLSCPLSYKFKYVDKVEDTYTSSALLFGSSFHKAIEDFLNHFKSTGLMLEQPFMMESYLREWSLNTLEVRYTSDTEDILRMKASAMFNLYRQQFDTQVEILEVEHFFSVEMVPGTPPFHGYIDLIEKSPAEIVTVVDHKTAAKRAQQSQIDASFQLTAYSIAADLLGFGDVDLRIDMMTKTKNPEKLQYKTSRSDHDKCRFMKLVGQVWRAIENQIWYPVQDDWKCGYCQYRKLCSEWK